MFNQEAMQNMMWGFIGEQFGKLPPEVRQALSRVEIDVVRQTDRLVVVARSEAGADDAATAGQNLLDSLARFVPEYLSRAFKVKVRIFEK